MIRGAVLPLPAVRTAWLLVLIALCYAVLRVGIGSVAATRSPDLALKVAPDNAAALVAASTRSLESLEASRFGAAAEFARRAYVREPVSSAALRQLGAIADVRGRPDTARTLLRASERLSRRDLLGQLMLIEDAVQRGDVREALVHYDIALRVSARAPALLFGTLSAATADPAVAEPLTSLLARRPPWTNAFLLQAAAISPSPRNMARLIIKLLGTGFAVTPPALESLIGRLIQARDYAAAWAVYASVDPGARRDGVRDPAFTGATANDLPFNWTFNVSGSASGTLTDDAGGSRLVFDSPVGTGGVVARQMLLLPPGAYRLSAKVVANNAGQPNAPIWRLHCVSSADEVALLPLPLVRAAPRQVSSEFQVSCAAQWLDLVLTATDDPEGVAGAVTNVIITPLSRREWPQ
jgi:hypothetical protein